MKLLLDTHVLIWALNGEDRASATVKAAVKDRRNQLYVSVASLWEATVKIANGKLEVPGQSIGSVLRYTAMLGAHILPVTGEHLIELEKLPRLNRDPFDRLIVAQSRAEKMRLVSSDRLIQQYEPDAIR